MSKTDLLEDVRRAFKAMDVRSQGFISLESFEKVQVQRDLSLLCIKHSSIAHTASATDAACLPLVCQTCALVIPRASKQVLLSVFREADRDGDGRVTYQDFERMYLLTVELDTRNHTS